MVVVTQHGFAQWLLHVMVEGGGTHAPDHPHTEEGIGHHRPLVTRRDGSSDQQDGTGEAHQQTQSVGHQLAFSSLSV